MRASVDDRYAMQPTLIGTRAPLALERLRQGGVGRLGRH
jgi:hypothetical protein